MDFYEKEEGTTHSYRNLLELRAAKYRNFLALAARDSVPTNGTTRMESYGVQAPPGPPRVGQMPHVEYVR